MKLSLLLLGLMMCAFNLASDDIHMHLHFENLSKERKLALSKMIKSDLANHKGVRATFCKAKCWFIWNKDKKNRCKAECERKHNKPA